MSIQSPAGTLDIKNATLRVGKLEVSNIQGVDTALNVTRANSVLIYDDQVSTTTFNGTTSSGSVRDTVNEYLDIAGGYVYWGQKLPNSWVIDFEMDIRSGTNGGPLYANVFSTTNTGGDGYSFTFNDSNNKISLYYDSTLLTETTVSGLFTASEDWQKVVINYERGLIAISLDGSRKFYYKDIERETPYVNGEYVSFSSASTDGRKIRDLRIVNGEKWVYSGESNVVYTQGSVGIGVTDPTVALDVSGTVKATAFDGDGSAITNISSANVGDFESNITRITNLETNRALKTDLDDNSSRISTISDDLSDNSSRITALETGDINISGEKTFTGEVIFESNLRVQGDLLVANTVNMTVYDPILELGSNNLNTGDVGLVMTRHGDSNSNVAIFFDETADTLKLGYTLNGANDTTLELDSNALAVSVQGALTVGSNLEVGTANLFVDTTTSNVGVGTDAPAYKLDVHGSANVGAITMNSNVYAPNLPLADTASNLVTWNSATGDFMDSGGLISNKFAVVSEQPPSALTGDTTTIQGHGKYVVTSSLEASGYQGWKCFDKLIGVNTNGWSSGAVGAYNSNGTYAGSNVIAGVSGEWVKIEFPYKTTLRHVALASRDSISYSAMPEDFSIVASNDDSTWVVLKSVDGQAWSSTDYVNFVVDASTAYKYYAIVVELTNNSFAQIGEWKLFTETFTVDAGVVSTTAASGLDVGYTEHPVEPMTNPIHYAEGHGTYEADASSKSIWFQSTYGSPFDYVIGNNMWESSVNWSSSNVYNNTNWTTDVGGTRHYGEWLQLKIPYAITLAYTDVYPRTNHAERSPGAGIILGSNDGENWYKLTEFSGKTYTTNGVATKIDVNATTPYTWYRIVTSKLTNATASDLRVDIGEWRLFAEKPVTRMENVHISGELSSETLHTGYIKWPRKSLKANESEGYVATRSSRAYSNYEAWKAFNENANSSDDAWIGGLTNYTTGGYSITTSGAPEMNGVYGDWLGIELPQSIKVSYIQLLNRNYSESARLPISGRFYGSKDNITFTELTAWSNISISPGYEPTRIDVNSNDTYKTYRIQVERINAATGGGSCAIGELQLFESTLGVGTSATTAKLTVDGGLGLAKGSHVFAGSDVVMELPRHDRPLVKYPEVAMTAAAYTASASRFDAAYYPYKAFNGLKGGNSGDVGWHTGTEPAGGIADYTGTSNTYVGTERLSSETVLGEWITIELPKPIKLKETHLWAQFNYSHVPKGGVFYGKRNASDTWTRLYSYTERSIRGRYNPQVHIINETRYFKYFAYVATERYLSASGISVGEWELYGYEEGDTSVDVVHRSIPNKPSQQHLEVYWDANDSNSYSFADSSNVYDLSGSGVTGTITGNNGFDAEYNAWVFDGSGDYVSGQLSSIPSADFVHSVSVWVKFSGDTLSSAYPYVCFVGGASQYSGSGLYLAGSNDENPEYPLHVSLWQLDYPIQCHLGNDEWYHVAFTYPGGGWSRSSVKAYINGVRYTLGSNRSGGTENSTATFTTTNVNIRLATASAGSSFEGSIANFRVYGKALNADQVRELYEYDALRFGHRQNLVALHKGNLGVGVAHPTSRFEVAGADGLQEFPPKAMTDYETYMEGHGVFRAYANSEENGLAWKAFNKSDAQGDGWVTDIDEFVADTGYSNTSTATTNTIFGRCSFLAIETPGLIKLEKIRLQPDVNTTGGPDAHDLGMPKDFQIWARKSGTEWTQIASYADQLFLYLTGSTEYYDINANDYYSEFAIVVTRTHTSSSYSWTSGTSQYSRGSIGEWRLFGTPAPSSLEDGHLTLGKALTLPRVSGHPAGAETPRAESLVLHYDTTVDSVVSGTTVVDTSGTGINGTLTNGAAYSSTDRAFTFDGVDDYVSGKLNNPSGAWVHSISFWMKPSQDQSTMGTTYEDVFQIGSTDANVN